MKFGVLGRKKKVPRKGVTLRQTTRSFRFLPFRVSPTHVSDGAETIRTCVDLKATPGDGASFLFLAL